MSHDNRRRRRNRKRRRTPVSRLPFALIIRYLAQGFLRFGRRPFRKPGFRPAPPAELRPAA